jgi:chemotaxis protein MotB
MARKKKPEEHENHERWLVSYADFITLLFAFFVVMYALSSVNEGKYRVLSDSLIAAFRNAPQSLKPIQIGAPVKAPDKVMPDSQPQLKAIPYSPPMNVSSKEMEEGGEQGHGRDRENLNKIQKQLEKALGRMIEQDLIAVKRTGRGLEVEINTAVLFDSGSALIQPAAVPTLTKVAAALKGFPNAVQVEGFTDDVPIDTPAYPSNWELSAGRAASVVHVFSDEGVDPFRMSAIGYGEYRPVALNTTAEGRRRNRRVVIVILSEAAEKLYNLDKVVELKAKDRPAQDIDLDNPPDLIELPLMTPSAPVPETGFPQELPLRGRDTNSGNRAEQQRLMDIMDQAETDPPREEDAP